MATKVSFVVSVYNVGKYVGACIESLLKQKGDTFEIILVNDGSSDDSGKICDRYAKKYSNIKVIKQENQGVSAARNQGLENSKGEWVFFVDGDDTVSNELLKQCKPFLNNNYDVCFVKHREVKDGSSILKKQKKKEVQEKRFSKEDFKEFELAIFNRDFKGKYDYHNVKMATPCKFYRKFILNKYNIRFPVGVQTGEDALFNLLVYKNAETGAYIDRELYYHRVWGDSVSQKYDPHIESKFELFHRKLRQYIKNLGNPERLTAAYNERCMWSLGFFCILKYCSTCNPNSYRMRKREFCDIRKKYWKEIRNVKLQNFRFEKKVLFWCIKKNWFFIINALCLMKKKA